MSGILAGLVMLSLKHLSFKLRSRVLFSAGLVPGEEGAKQVRILG